MPRPPQARPESARLEEENSDLRRKLRESERRSQLAVGILRQARAVYGIETSLKWKDYNCRTVLTLSMSYILWVLPRAVIRTMTVCHTPKKEKSSRAPAIITANKPLLNGLFHPFAD